MELFENERCLIGAMMIDNSIIESVYNSLKPNAFADARNKIIYEAILSLCKRGIGADISTVYSEVNGKVDAFYISEFTDIVPSAANWSYYANNVKNEFLYRSVYEIVSVSKDTMEKNKNNIKFQSQDMINELLAKITDVTKDVIGAKSYNMRDLVKSEIIYLQECMDNKKEWLGYDTGFPGLNNIINGLQPVYMVIGARPSMGKTALAQKMALNISKTEKTVFIELEMSPRQLVERAISNLTQIPFRKIQAGFLTTAAMQKLGQKMDELSQNENFIPCECPTRQLNDIVNLCRSQVRNNGVKVIFIDHMGLIRCNVNAQSFEKARLISNTLQQLQRELSVPIIVLSQLGRESENNKSSLSSFRGSGAIEEDADICIFINRDRASSEDDTEIPADIVVAKNRDGSVGDVKMIFKPQIVDFIDVSESYEEKMMRCELDRQETMVKETSVKENAEVETKAEEKHVEPVQEDLFDWVVQDPDDGKEKYDIF